MSGFWNVINDVILSYFDDPTIDNYYEYPSANFSNSLKPDPVICINNIQNSFVRKTLISLYQEMALCQDISIIPTMLDNSTNIFYPLYFVALRWKEVYGRDLTDERIIKDILRCVYNELYPIGIMYISYLYDDDVLEDQHNYLIEFYHCDINITNYFGDLSKDNNLLSLNNDILLNLYLKWIYNQVIKCHYFKSEYPLKVNFVYENDFEPPIEFRQKLMNKFMNYPKYKSVCRDPFVHGNTIYIQEVYTSTYTKQISKL